MGIDALGLRKEHYKGASSELKAASWFLDNSYQVYLPIVQQSWVDFIVEKGRRFEKVQVKTATVNKSGVHQYLQCRTLTTNKVVVPREEAYDILFVVYEDSFWKIPADQVKSSNLCFWSSNPKSKKVYRMDEYKVK